MRAVLLVAVAVVSLSACPDRREAIDQVGGAPKRQVDEARKRIDKAEDKMQQNADKASAVTAE